MAKSSSRKLFKVTINRGSVYYVLAFSFDDASARAVAKAKDEYASLVYAESIQLLTNSPIQ